MMATYTYPKSLQEDKTMRGYIQFMSYERKTRKDAPPKDTINLYMPEQVQNPNTVQWDQQALGMVAGIAERNLRGTEMTAGSIASGLGNTASDYAEALGGKIPQAIGSGILSLGGNAAGAQGAVESITGKVANPYYTWIFKGVNFRTFQFLFKLYPHSKDEAQTIHDMIKSFRKGSLPAGEGGSNEAFYGYPDEYEITYYFEDNENKFLHKFKRSVITALDTDYTASGMWSMTRDGFPAEINLNLRFSELEVVLRTDVENGY